MKVSTAIFIGTPILAGLALLGIYGLSTSIYKSRSCEWANIDNIEMNGGVNIPAINDCTCSYSKTERTKKAVFEFDHDQVDIEHYIRIQGFTKITASETAFIAPFEMLDASVA